VGVLTQYQPLILNEYIGNGQPWDLDRNFGGVHILSPYQAKEGSEWFKGTTNAIYQNLYFIKRYNPEHVLILSGDHIYKMDYAKMLNQHVETGADCTIAAYSVPLEEASRFGILNTNKDGCIYEFEEKPKKPKSNLASMGIYIFTAEKLYKYLEEDSAKSESSNDFGKDVLPSMLANGEKMMAYKFEGYWKDVGTIDSLFEANMDLLGDKPTLNIRDNNWKIQSRSPLAPPHFIGEGAKVDNSIVLAGCEVFGNLENSILASDVIVEKGATVRNSIIMANVTIEKDAVVENSIIDEFATIRSGARVGSCSQDNKGISVIGRSVVVGVNALVESGVIIDKDV
jgi:glucose-1-phosphate adenylyltransferase